GSAPPPRPGGGARGARRGRRPGAACDRRVRGRACCPRAGERARRGTRSVLSRSGFFRRILESPSAREFMLNSLAVGEAESAVELARVAEHVPDRVLARRIYRHFAEEQKHARLLTRHLESQGFRSTPLPPELDYEQLVQHFGMGTPKSRLDDPRPFDDD